MAAERIPDQPDAVPGQDPVPSAVGRAGGVRSRSSTPRLRPSPTSSRTAGGLPARAASGSPKGNGAGPAHATVAMDRREPVFDRATSHVLVADRTLDGRPLGGAKPVHLSVPSRVRLRLAHVGPWSAAKLALLFGALIMAAIVAGLVILWGLLDAAGVLQAVQKLVNSSGVGHHFRFDGGWILIRVIWVAAGMVLAGAIIATCLAALYNSLADLTGGLDVTFVEHPDTVVAAAEAPTWVSRFTGTRLSRHDRVPDPANDPDLPEASGL